MPDEFDEDLLETARRELAGGATAPREFQFACALSEIPPAGGRGKVIRYEDTEVALFHLTGEIFAISHICPHELSPLLAAGTVNCQARTVTCPLHGWTFGIDTGKRTDGPGATPAYDVRIESGEVWIRLRE